MNDELRIRVPKGFVIDTENSNLNEVLSSLSQYFLVSLK